MRARCASRCAPISAAAIAGLWHRDQPVLRSTEPASLESARLSGCYPAAAVLEPTRLPPVPLEGPVDTRRGRTSKAAPHSLHGVGWMRPWEIESSSAVDVVLRLPARRRRRLAVRVRGAPVLQPERRRSLSVQMVFTNRAEIAQPVGLGWHPVLPPAPAQPPAHRPVRSLGCRRRRSCRSARSRSPASTAMSSTSASTTASKAGAARRASATRSSRCS